MLAYFPSPYPDELFYSLLSRFYVQSGYLSYTNAAQDIYGNKNTKINVKFLNKLSPDTTRIITKNISLEELIEKQTILPYYIRFMNKERRNSTLQSLIENGYTKLSRASNSLRYCPLCAKHDREKYGEAYWHRNHQLFGIDICNKHNCQLVDTDIGIASKTVISFVSAEEYIPYEYNVVFSTNPLEQKLTQYVTNVFQSKVDMKTDIKIGDFFHSKMEYTKYLSTRGEQRNITLICDDFIKYYNTLQNNPIKEIWQLKEIFASHKTSTYENCLVAIFLNIPVEELVNMQLPNKSQQELFDEKIIGLHEQGMNYRQISHKLNISYDVVKLIGEGKYYIRHKNYNNDSKIKHKSYANKLDWNKIDEDTLLLVKQAIKQIQDDKTNKPKRITKNLIENELKLPKKRLDKCQKCLVEINKHYETYEEYCARVIKWGYDKLKNEPELSFSKIRKITNIERKNMILCLPYLVKYMSKEEVQIIINIIK